MVIKDSYGREGVATFFMLKSPLGGSDGKDGDNDDGSKGGKGGGKFYLFLIFNNCF